MEQKTQRARRIFTVAGGRGGGISRYCSAALLSRQLTGIRVVIFDKKNEAAKRSESTKQLHNKRRKLYQTIAKNKLAIKGPNEKGAEGVEAV